MALELPLLVPDASPEASLAARDGVDAAAAVAKEAALVGWLRAHGPVLVGFSGGVDSAYLAVVARQTLGRDGALSVIGRSASFPAEQWAVAHGVAEAHGLEVLEVATDELDDADYAANPVNRCYHCKKTLWRHLVPLAATHGTRTVIDGANADDLLDHRPGARAADERGVRSPLAEVGMTKAEIRLRSRAHGLATWDRPSSPCLASRLPYGLSVTPERLAAVERAESALRALGVTGNLRVRHHEALARVELDADVLEAWASVGELARLQAAVRGAGFARAALDVFGFRSGSLNVLGGVQVADASDAPRLDDAAMAWADGVGAPESIGGLRLWSLPPSETAVTLASAVRRAALMARVRRDGGTHGALTLADA